jgi:hypothetical protein
MQADDDDTARDRAGA